MTGLQRDGIRNLQAPSPAPCTALIDNADGIGVVFVPFPTLRHSICIKQFEITVGDEIFSCNGTVDIDGLNLHVIAIRIRNAYGDE